MSTRATRRRRAAANEAVSKPWTIRNAAGGNVPVIELFGDIGVSKEGDPWWGMEGGVGTFQEFANELKALGPVPELRVEIHSYGGSVIVGKAIHDKLREHKAKKTAVIYGICASAATYPALACDIVEIPANSFFLIHNSMGICIGDADDMQRESANLYVCDESIAALYAARTGKGVDEIRDIMDEDTWMTGTEAVAMGLADKVVEPVKVEPAAKTSPKNFRRSAIDNMPETAGVWFSSVLNSAKGKPVTTAVANPPAVPAVTPTQPALVVPTTPVAEVVNVVTPPVVAPVAPTIPPVVPQANPVAQPDVPVNFDAQVQAGIAAERSRISNLTALCSQAGHSSMAQKFIDDGTSVADAQGALFKKMVADRPPVGDAAVDTPIAPAKNGDEKFVNEFKADPAYAVNMTQDEYVAMRRVDCGLDLLKTGVPVK